MRRYLFERRWRERFVYPGCGGGRAGLLKSKAFIYECADCGRQTSVTAATIMRANAADDDLVLGGVFDGDALHGTSALILRNRLGLGSYRIA